MSTTEKLAFLAGWAIGGVAMDIHPASYAAGLGIGLTWIILTMRAR